MLTGAALIGEWSSGIWVSLGGPPTLSALTISGFASQPNTLGTLNARLDRCFRGTGEGGTGYAYASEPPLTNAELAIVEGIFLVSWYNQLAFATMGAGGSTIPWVRLREGDSLIDRSNPANIGEQYREMSKSANEQLNYLVNAYITNSGPSFGGVDYLNPGYPYPYGGGNYYGNGRQQGLFPGGGAIGGGSIIG